MTNEDLLAWLTQKLHLELEAIQEQHRSQSAIIKHRHEQLLVEMEANLRQDAPSEREDTDEKLADDEQLQTAIDAHDEQLADGGSEAISAHKEKPPHGDGNWQSALPVQQETRESDSQSDTRSALPQQKLSYKHSTLNIISGLTRVRDENRSFLQRIVESPQFECVCAIVILINTLILACEIEFYGLDSGHDVGWAKGPSQVVVEDVTSWFVYVDVIFTCLFSVELLMRVGAAGWRCVLSGWLWFDAVIVGVSIAVRTGAYDSDSVNPTVMRIARIARTIRAFKMIRVIKAFESLYLLLRSLQVSVGALFWSFVFLIFVETAVGMCISQLVRQYIQDQSYDVSDRREVFFLFGTFTRSMVTMFEITIGNWVPSCRILMNNVSEWFGLFYVLYSGCYAFAVTRVIQAVFIAETNRMVAADDQTAVIRKQRDRELCLKRMRLMFDELDTDNSGRLSRDELQALLHDKLLKTMMHTLDVVVDDVGKLFDVFDDGDGELDIDEFIKGLSKFKGPAQSFDVVTALKITQTIDNKIDSMLELCNSGALARRRKVFV